MTTKDLYNKILLSPDSLTIEEVIFCWYSLSYLENRDSQNTTSNFKSNLALLRTFLEKKGHPIELVYRSLAFALPFDFEQYYDLLDQMQNEYFTEHYFTSASYSLDAAYYMANYWLNTFKDAQIADQTEIVMLVLENVYGVDIDFTELKEVILSPASYKLLDQKREAVYLPELNIKTHLSVFVLRRHNREVSPRKEKTKCQK